MLFQLASYRSSGPVFIFRHRNKHEIFVLWILFARMVHQYMHRICYTLLLALGRIASRGHAACIHQGCCADLSLRCWLQSHDSSHGLVLLLCHFGVGICQLEKERMILWRTARTLGRTPSKHYKLLRASSCALGASRLVRHGHLRLEHAAQSDLQLLLLRRHRRPLTRMLPPQATAAREKIK